MEAPTAEGLASQTRMAAFERIAWLEDRRSNGGLELERLALSQDLETRLRAIRALGRMPFPELGSEVTKALLRGLQDQDPQVRALSAFGLGLRADPDSTSGLLAAWNDPAELVRARLVEAGSRFEDLSIREEVMYSLSDPSVLVRAEAALAPHRWDPTSGAAAVVDSALSNVAAKAPVKQRQDRWGTPEDASFEVEPENGQVIWSALFSLSRRKAERGREVFYLWCRAEDNVLARIFATRGLGSLQESTPATREALRECLGDQDWRVVVEAAVGLGRFPDPSSLPVLDDALDHPETNVRMSVARSLGSYKNERLLARPILERTLVDISPNVRAAGVRSLSQLFSNEVAADLEARALDRQAMVRKGVADSCQYLSAGAALPILARLIRDQDPAVAYTAAEGLGNFLDEGGRELALELLGSPDNGLRLGAVMALQVSPLPGDLPSLLRCYSSSEGDIADEIQTEIMRAASQLKDDRAFEILNQGLRSTRPYNRELALELMTARFPSSSPTGRKPLPPRSGEVPRIDVTRGNPRVEVRTNRGSMIFELYMTEAPVHVYNFMTLARQNAYDGLRFHRVVPDFVIQGGDYRGDGNGGVSWRGEPLRNEFNELEYVEGSLGMPRNSDPDSGGSQFFVTHRATPHLNGRYTLFGQLVQGFDTLAEIEEGDSIIEVRVRGE
jgi:cyclophilin family peptidyl-prolyl cis-trans isomerase/HEAT repeat protein